MRQEIWTPKPRRIVRPGLQCSPFGQGLAFARPPKILGANFLPTSIAGLQAWWRADLGVTIGTGVSSWADQSGGGHTLSQATGAKQPTVNASNASYANRPTLHFTSAAQAGLVAATFVLSQPYTILVAGNYDGSGSKLAFVGSNGSVVEAFIVNNGFNNAAIYAGSFMYSALANTATPQAMGGVFSGGSSALYVSAKTATISGAAGAAALSDIAVGWYAAIPVGLDGDIADICIYNSALNAANVGLVLSYFGSRYGIAIGV